MRPPTRRSPGAARFGLAAALVAVVVLGAVTHATADGTSEQQCQRARYMAAGKFVACHEKVLASYLGGVLQFGDAFQGALLKCRTSYAKTWPKLQARYTGSTCDAARLEANGDGTVTDHLTGLQWEQKTDDASVHDKDNLYKWTAGGPSSATADGTEFTLFLAALNTVPCLGGHCDWRLPTLSELGTILAIPCAISPCIDEAAFGPTIGARYQSTTTALDTSFPTDETFAWQIQFDVAWTSAQFKGGNVFVRAVRGGL